MRSRPSGVALSEKGLHGLPTASWGLLGQPERECAVGGRTAVRFPTAIVGIVLTEFSAYVWSNEPGVRHYGRQG